MHTFDNERSEGMNTSRNLARSLMALFIGLLALCIYLPFFLEVGLLFWWLESIATTLCIISLTWHLWLLDRLNETPFACNKGPYRESAPEPTEELQSLKQPNGLVFIAIVLLLPLAIHLPLSKGSVLTLKEPMTVYEYKASTVRSLSARSQQHTLSPGEKLLVTKWPTDSLCAEFGCIVSRVLGYLPNGKAVEIPITELRRQDI